MGNIFTRVILALSCRNIIRMSDKEYIKLKFKYMMGKKLDLENPKTFNEKLQWLKLYDRNPDYTKMVDKYDVKQYISNVLGDEYVIPTLGVYEKVEQIDFDSLPDKFVIKPTHTSGNIYICNNKDELDKQKIRKICKKWLKRKFYNLHKEWAYKNVKSRIIIEKYMQDGDNLELKDYKFYCFNGEPRYLYVSEGLSNHKTARIAFFDLNFEKAEFGRTDYKTFIEKPEKPKNFDKMKEIATKLSQNIPFIRVDLYEINSKIYFGELTFFPCAGYMLFNPPEWDEKLGEMLVLPQKKEE